PTGFIDPLGLAGGCCDELLKNQIGKEWDVGDYSVLRDSVVGHNLGLDAHHVGQKALMKNLVKDYDPQTAPAILVTKEGHTIRRDEIVGVVSRSRINPNTGEVFTDPRSLMARDIRELRRVYPEVPNKKLQELIQLNKDKYPEMNK
ncbi:RHS family protein, partial [Providencia sp. Me31A]